jgi:PAT family beta-lactamase induction signal transducer AmpG
VITIAGTFLGGLACTFIGVGHSLWVFGALQIFSNLGYVLITHFPGNRPLYYGALSFELVTTGLGMGAFGVMLLRMTRKRFSATQYALFSSLFGLPRILAGPVTGFVVHAAGWRFFFYMTMVAGIPGLILLQRFSPLGVRDPDLTLEEPRKGRPLSTPQLVRRGLVGGAAGFGVCLLVAASLDALRALRVGETESFDLGGALTAVLRPAGAAGWLELGVVAVLGAICGLFVAAVAAAYHGARPEGE